MKIAREDWDAQSFDFCIDQKKFPLSILEPKSTEIGFRSGSN